MRMVAMIVAALLAVQPVAAQEAGAPLQPVGPWGVDYANNSCVVSHSFGAGARKIDVVFQLLPRSDSATVAIAAAVAPGAGGTRGKAVVTLQPGGQRIETDFYSAPLRDGRRSFIFRIWGDDFAALIQSSEIRVVAGRTLDVALAPRAMPAAFHAADACKDDLLKSWNIDPVPLATAITRARPRGSPGAWITNADYPTEAVRDNISGTTVFRLTIDSTGAVTGCGIVITSGSEVLDKATCGLMRRRAKFYPALDAGGKPVSDLYINRFTWMVWGS